MMNDPLACEGYMWEKYPDLARRKIFCTEPYVLGFKSSLNLDDLNNLIKFIVLFVDPTSPLAKEKDFDYRTNAALGMLGLSKYDLFFQEIEKNTLYWNCVLATYFAATHAIEYESWFTSKMALHHISMELRANIIPPNERRMTMKIMDEMTEDFLKKEHRLFPDEYTRNAVVASAELDQFAGYAERYAQDIKN